MNNILFAWIGLIDRRAAEENYGNENNMGGIARCLVKDKTQYTKVILLSDNPKEDADITTKLSALCEKHGLSPQPSIMVAAKPVKAMDRPAIYQATQEAVQKYSAPGDKRRYLVSSGTPAMQLCTTLFAHSPTWGGISIEASKEEGVKEVEPWVELAHAIMPTLPTKFDKYLVESGKGLDTKDDIIGEHEGIERAKAWAKLAAQGSPDKFPVLILGETGTGKEGIAQLVHQLSQEFHPPKKDEKPQNPPKPKLVAINCSAIAKDLLESELFGHVKGAFTGANEDKKGIFEAANGGTVFLDEIGDMPLPLQTKLLRVLQEREITKVGSTDEIKIINTRIIAATHKDLRQGVAEGWFREDLYYRLNVIEIHLPALRDRKSDIAALAGHFLKSINANFKNSNMAQVVLSDDAMQPLLNHSWRGNVRELDNTLQRAGLFAQLLTHGDKDVVPCIDANILKEVLVKPINKNTLDNWGSRNFDNGYTLDTLVDDLKYHYYQRFRNEKDTRNELAEAMSMTEPTLRKFEDKWKAQGCDVDKRQERPNRKTKNID